MELIHDPAEGAPRRLAGDVRVADTFVSRARGLMFRPRFPGDALLFEFDGPGRRTLHMLFVPFPIDAVWLLDGEVQQVARLRPFIGIDGAPADRVLELPAGSTDPVRIGDRIRIAE